MKKFLLICMFTFLGFQSQAEERYITTSDGVELYVSIKGNGEPCLYLHGGPGSGSYWVEKFFGEQLEKQFTMIYLDQRGVGRSSSPQDQNYSLERMALDFEEVRKALGYETWITLGHSFGGILQMGYLEYFPQSSKGLIMVNCTLDINESFCESWSPKAAEFLGITDLPGCANDTVPLMDRMQSHIYELKQKDIFWKMGFGTKEAEALLDATYSEIPNWNFNFGNAAFSYEDYWKDFKPATAEVTVPVLFYYGTKDWMVGPQHYKGMQFQNMLLWENEGGHIPFMENKEDLEKAILTFRTVYNF
jgi:proline iminopeptidase